MSSIASSIPCIKIPITSSTTTTCSSSSSSTSSTFRFYVAKPSIVTIRCSQTDGPIRRPVTPTPTPTLREPPSPSSSSSSSSPSSAPLKPSTPPSPPSQISVPVSSGAGSSNAVVTLEFQRQMAKELQSYFKQKKLEEASQGPFFGFFAKNEISNGRWAMFGFAVGMLTEYATGSDFVDQVKILLSNFGIVDLE